MLRAFLHVADAPTLERTTCSADRTVDISRCAGRHCCDDLLGRRVDDFEYIASRRLDPSAVDVEAVATPHAHRQLARSKDGLRSRVRFNSKNPSVVAQSNTPSQSRAAASPRGI